MDDIIRQAVDAYMHEDWKRFRALAAKLDEPAKKRLVKALYIP